MDIKSTDNFTEPNKKLIINQSAKFKSSKLKPFFLFIFLFGKAFEPRKKKGVRLEEGNKH
jgi:hypothetical protein